MESARKPHYFLYLSPEPTDRTCLRIDRQGFYQFNEMFQWSCEIQRANVVRTEGDLRESDRLVQNINSPDGLYFNTSILSVVHGRQLPFRLEFAPKISLPTR
jgi:hypothetical protein